jgi:thioesterase domain-containing protein
VTSGKPRVFLLPGIGGDETSLADFRNALADRVTFDLIDYPDIDRPSREIRDFRGIVDEAVRSINARHPSGQVHIAGYSFGGQVAFTAACRLQEEGRRVGLVALIDSRALSLTLPGAGMRVRNRDEAPGPALAAADAASRLLIGAGLSEIVRHAIGPTRRLLGTDAADSLRRLLLQNLRGRALRGATHGRFDGPVSLFRAQEQLVAGLPPDLGWSAHCSAVRSVELRGGHNSLFRDDHLSANAEAIWSELMMSLS